MKIIILFWLYSSVHLIWSSRLNSPKIKKDGSVCPISKQLKLHGLTSENYHCVRFLVAQPVSLLLLWLIPISQRGGGPVKLTWIFIFHSKFGKILNFSEKLCPTYSPSPSYLPFSFLVAQPVSLLFLWLIPISQRVKLTRIFIFQSKFCQISQKSCALLIPPPLLICLSLPIENISWKRCLLQFFSFDLHNTVMSNKCNHCD